MIAFFIGSFNPPTKAHLEICLKLKNEFQKIILVPVNSRNKELISFKHRYQMLSIYERQYDFLKIDCIMNNYSYFDYRLLDILKDKYHDNNIIIGSDLLKKIKDFDNYEYLLDNYVFHIVTRDNDDVLKIVNEYYCKYQHHIKIYPMVSVVSSTKARNLIKNNQNLENILDQEIISYIRNNHLYF